MIVVAQMMSFPFLYTLCVLFVKGNDSSVSCYGLDIV
jgi:hypothetical protein